MVRSKKRCRSCITLSSNKYYSKQYYYDEKVYTYPSFEPLHIFFSFLESTLLIERLRLSSVEISSCYYILQVPAVPGRRLPKQ
jgi:hypothetical protein